MMGCKSCAVMRERVGDLKEEIERQRVLIDRLMFTVGIREQRATQYDAGWNGEEIKAAEESPKMPEADMIYLGDLWPKEQVEDASIQKTD